ncbi:MAG: lysophospholipid acyltransferase family protein [Pseudomonadota bacterium]
MRFFRSLLFQIWMYGLMALLGILFFPLAAWSREGAYWAIRRYISAVFWGLRNLCGLTYEIRGEPPKGEALIACKHQSFLDILIVMRAVPAAKFVMKRSLVYAPILGFYALRIGASPVTRGKGSESLSDMMKGVEGKRTARGQLVIYPQGTRVAPDVKAPYKAGAHAIYQAYDLPCHPAAVNTGLFWPRMGVTRKAGIAVLEFLPPLPAGLDQGEFMERLEVLVEPASDRLAAEARDRFEV